MRRVQNPYLFESVLSALATKFHPFIDEEMASCAEAAADLPHGKIRSFLVERFETFPRSVGLYSQMILTLSDVSSYDVVSVLVFLSGSLITILQGRHCRTFSTLKNMVSRSCNLDGFFVGYFMRGFELILLTDTVCNIVTSMKEMDEQTARALIRAGISLCMTSPEEMEFASFLLEQWSVTISVVSKLAPNVLFDVLTQLIVNRSDLLFVLVRYLRLDVDQTHSQDLVDLMRTHVMKSKQRKVLTSSMLISLSTFLMTYQGDCSSLKDLFDLANTLCEKPKDNPGAVELVSTLLPKMHGVTKEMIYEFYEKKVFPLTGEKDGMKTAVRALRNLMYGKDIEPDFLFWNWGPSHRENSFDFVNWNGAESKDQYSKGSFGQIFMEHYITSPYFGQCQQLIRDILVHLAALDFKFFTDVIYESFTKQYTTDRFMCFLRAVPMINDPEFVKRTNLANEIEEFNGKLGNFTGSHLQEIIGGLSGYGFPGERYESYRKPLENASRTVELVLGAWNVPTGDASDVGIIKVGVKKEGGLGQPGRIVKIIPYVINSQMFEEAIWTEYLLKLAALLDTSISKPAYNICRGLLQQPNRRDLVITCAVGFIMQRQHPAIVCTCLTLLLEAIEEMEPEIPKDMEAIQYSIEFAGFLSLACAHPVARSIGFELLWKMNKILQNQGLYSVAEMQFSAITSNVKHNILLQQFSKRPGHHKYPPDELSLDSARNSRYQDPWLFFLAELGKVVVSANYSPVLIRIQQCCQDFCRRRSKDFDLGLLVIFFATCTITRDRSFYFCETPMFTTEVTFDADLDRVIEQIQKGNDKESEKLRDYMATAMKHANYTIVPKLIKVIADSRKGCYWLPSMYMLLCCIEANNMLKKNVFDNVKIFLQNCNRDFVTEHLNCRTLNLPVQSLPNFSKQDSRRILEKESLVLSYLSCVVLWLDVDDNRQGLQDITERTAFVHFCLNWVCFASRKDNEQDWNTIRLYSAAALESLLAIGYIYSLPDSMAKSILRTLSDCNRCGFEVLKPLLEHDLSYLKLFIAECFGRKPVVADLFFDAIYHVINQFQSLRSNTRRDARNGPLEILNRAGSLFLLGLFRLKTGSTLASNFLKAFVPLYAQIVDHTDQELTDDLENLPIEDVLVKHFMEVAESVVSAALEEMTNTKFKGTIKVLVDIIIPWLRLFRMLPGQSYCVPILIDDARPRLTPRDFLRELMKITENKKDDHDFQRLVDIWATILSIPDHKQIVPIFIIECQDVTTREMLAEKLLPTYPRMIIGIIAQRCKFAYFAYVSYQLSRDFDQAIWFVPIIMRALKHHMDHCGNHLYMFVHFAILFHANQTQSLLKRLCKCMGIPYSRRTLSSGSVREIVKVFGRKLLELQCQAVIPPRAMSPEPWGTPDEEGEDRMDEKEKEESPPDPIGEWAKEAMRWAIGCKILKIAHLSLVIFNSLPMYSLSQEDQQDLLRGLCKSAANFLSKCKAKDPLTYEYINETFRVFQTHFVGNEELALEYIRAYLTFVVSVDAYFDEMIPLYKKCCESPKTRDEALKDLLPVLQPTFNELELNSQAHKTFIEFCRDFKSPATIACEVDLNFIRAVLQRTDRSFHEKGDDDLVKTSTSTQRNRALHHFSLMIDTASVDLKKRIFVLSTMILEQFEEERKNARQREKRNPVETKDDLTPTTTTDVTNESTMKAGYSPKISEDTQNDSEDPAMSTGELNTQALVVIFRSAVQMLPGMQQALDFMKILSAIDPLIATVPIIDEMEWEEAGRRVVTELARLGVQENANVSLTDCTNLGSVSNLLNEESQPKILPYNSQRDLLHSVLQKPEGRIASRSSAREIKPKVAHELQRRISERSSPKIRVPQGVWEPLVPPQKLRTDDILASQEVNKERPLTLDDIVGKSADFLKMPDQ